METTKNGTGLRNELLNEFNNNFQNSHPSFSNLLWQIIINEAWLDKKPHCFIATYDKNGLVIGMAEHGEQGYYNTKVYFKEDINYDKASVILDKINEKVFGLLPKACMDIVASSMRYVAAG